MGKIRRKFDIEFKRQVAAAITSGQTTLSAAAREHQISISVIRAWTQKFRAGQPLQAYPSKREREQEDRIAKLERKLAQLVMENDHLKKFNEFVRQEQRLNDVTSVVTKANLHRYRRGAK